MIVYQTNMRYILVFCIVIYSQLTFGQSKLVNVDFDKATIDRVITDLENKTGYSFYYDAAVFDSLRVTLIANQQTFESILYSAFKNTDFRFVVTQRHEVFLTKGRAVQTKLANNYFNFHGKPNQQVTNKITLRMKRKGLLQKPPPRLKRMRLVYVQAVSMAMLL